MTLWDRYQDASNNITIYNIMMTHSEELSSSSWVRVIKYRIMHDTNNYYIAQVFFSPEGEKIRHREALTQQN